MQGQVAPGPSLQTILAPRGGGETQGWADRQAPRTRDGLGAMKEWKNEKTCLDIGNINAIFALL